LSVEKGEKRGGEENEKAKEKRKRGGE